MRGKANKRSTSLRTCRIIPAGAGKRIESESVRKAVRDHPRGCGEKIPKPIHKPQIRGSSPRVRGKGQSSERPRTATGIIPAGAGKRTSAPSHRPQGWDHPRGCGEKRLWRGVSPRGWGSSPRVRGKGTLSYNGITLSRIIPAGAGKRGLVRYW